MTDTVAWGVGRLDHGYVDSFVRRWADGWNRHDADALVGLCAEDVIWDDPAMPAPERGRAAVREYLLGAWRMFPDLTFDLPEAPLIAREGPRAAQVWRMTGTMLGSDPWAGFAPTGKRVEFDGVDLYEFRDGLLAHYRGRYDMAECARQLGLAPARGSRAERTIARLQRTAMRLRRRRPSAAA
jgi:steroid delta-isomerase-like uncharacterized protein